MWQLGGDKVRILICDDDARIREKIRECIKIYLQGIEVKRAEIVLFADGNELLKDKGQKDIVFLDIEMSGANGIYVGEKLKEANANVIIIVVTAYSEYLDDAMRFQVFRYLSKPLDRQRLLRNMKDAVAQYYSIQSMEKKIPIEPREKRWSCIRSCRILILCRICSTGRISCRQTSFSVRTAAFLSIWGM